MKFNADDELTMFVYMPEAGSKSEESLNLLASWTVSNDAEHSLPSADH